MRCVGIAIAIIGDDDFERSLLLSKERAEASAQAVRTVARDDSNAYANGLG